MLKARGDNIDEFEEHEVDIGREDFYSDKKAFWKLPAL